MSLPQPPPPTQTTCFRHPGREAGRRCTRCGRPACNDCLVQATVGSHCVECARAAKPDVKSRAVMWNARQPTLVTYILIALNVAVFVWMGIADPSNFGGTGQVTEQQFDLGLVAQRFDPFDPVPRVVGVSEGEWYRLVSSGFIHFGVIHLLFNMWLLYQLGQLIEPAVGRVRFALIYFAALLGGSAGALLLQPNSVHGGASGAVFGLMAAAAIGLYQRGINPFSTGIGALLVINLGLTLFIPGISIGGHLGGIVAGAACALVTMAPARRFPEWATYAAPVGVIAISLATVYATV
jgi:membrane associated rhomboid family serine protease